MKPDRTFLIDQLYDVLDDEQYGVACLFPRTGDGCLTDLAERYGDDPDVLRQSASWFLVHSGDGDTCLLVDAEQRPMIGTSHGMVPVAPGARWDGPNGEVWIATDDDWVKVEGDEKPNRF